MRFHYQTLIIVTALIAAPTPAAIIYVDITATAGGDDGTTWCDAYLDLQDALSAASSGDEIRTADGTYKPTSGASRTATFQLIDGVEINGGYAGCNDGGDTRDIALYETILSGAINAGVDTDNSYHVVTGSSTNVTAVLDGFTITKGFADGDGGGMYNDDGDPTVSNCTFFDNHAEHVGGGMFNSNSHPTVTDCVFRDNTAGSDGGGMDCTGSVPTLTDCLFEDNGATGQGGGGSSSRTSPLP